MNSKTGFRSLIGKETAKIVAFGTRNISCRTCNIAERKRKEAKSHDCLKNWTKSSKAMEPDFEVELPRKVIKRGVGVSAIVTDKGSSTIKKYRDEIDPNLQKRADVGHTTKNLQAHVETISSRHQGVTKKVIGHLEKCFTYAVNQNEGKPADVKKALLNVIPHFYGGHESCGEWCGYLRNPEHYKHATLPYGRDLTDFKLKKDLNKIFENFADRSEELACAPSGSIQANEAINSIVGSKAPKIRHYGDSESSDFTGAAAVCQKNEGHSYIFRPFSRSLASKQILFAFSIARNCKMQTTVF